MNLWVKRTGQLFLAALFLMSCNDDSLLLGFKNPNDKLEVRFVELPVESSVVLLDKIRTTNYFGFETSRLLVGRYNDNSFGGITAEAYTQFYYPATSNDKEIDPDAELDSLVMHLRYDYYTYASDQATVQTFKIFELEQELINDSTYYSDDAVAYGNEVATVEVNFNPNDFEQIIEDGKTDSVIMIDLPIAVNSEFALRLFNTAKSSIGGRDADSTVTKFENFKKEFKGFAFVPVSGDKVFGINPARNSTDSTSSRLTMRYKTDTDTLKLDFYFGNVMGFSKVSTDRSGTQLSGLINTYQDYDPGDLRYIQSITGVATKINIDSSFASFYKFADTIPEIILNSAELIVTAIESPGFTEAPASLALKPVSKYSKNRLLTETDDDDSVFLLNYKLGPVTSDKPGYDYLYTSIDNSYAVVGDDFSAARIALSSNAYSAYVTSFMKKLYDIHWECCQDPDSEDEDARLREFYLIGLSPDPRKSVHRTVFHKDNIKLRIYYSVPVK
ncbi:MAG: DUF4270 domain-containing protein [Flammeovirgaceae bacterium]|nr:DUF4270 domain-containing protein [Flammeovirgaceae bacterium]